MVQIPDAAVDLAIDAQVRATTKYTRMKLDQGPGEGNYDRIERLMAEDMLRAALPALEEAWQKDNA